MLAQSKEAPIKVSAGNGDFKMEPQFSSQNLQHTNHQKEVTRDILSIKYYNSPFVCHRQQPVINYKEQILKTKTSFAMKEKKLPILVYIQIEQYRPPIS